MGGVITTQYKDGQRYINLNPGRLFNQQPPTKGKRSRGSFKLLHQCRPQDKNKSNYNTNTHASLTKKTKINTNKTKAMFSRLLRHPGMETEWDYSGRMGRDEKQEDR